MTKELSMQELLDQQEQLLNSIKVGDTITGTITKINNDEVLAIGDITLHPKKKASIINKP